MQFSVKPAYEKLIRKQIEAGHYRSASEFVEDAIDLLTDHQRMLKRDEERLAKMLASAVAQSKRGESKPVDLEEMKAKARVQRATRLRKR